MKVHIKLNGDIIGIKTVYNGEITVLESYVQSHDCRALFTMHSVEGPGSHIVDQIKFRHDNVFPSNTDKLYKEHRESICNQLSYDISNKNNFNECKNKHFPYSNSSFHRGHLAAKVDFKTEYGQIATFTYANSAPQMGNMNMGQWSSIECTVRKLSNIRKLYVITGTLGTFARKNRQQIDTDIFLSTYKTIPVPAMFYKIIIDNLKRETVVLVIPNDSLNPIWDCICPNNKFDKLNWIKKNDKKKYFHCACELKDFIQFVPNLNYLRDKETSFGLLTGVTGVTNEEC